MGYIAKRVALAVGALAATVCSAIAADIRVGIQTVSPTYLGNPVTFGKGGRVGNWLSGSGSSVVMDATFATMPSLPYLTNIFTFDPSTTTPSLNLISNPGTWTAGGPSGTPATGEYVGNPWFCPGTPANAYILFQAQNSGSFAGSFGQPGGGYDNDIWIYRPAVGSAPPKTWKLTNYGIAPMGTLGPAVFGPQCSQDSSGTSLHIVYGHLSAGAPASTCNSGNGPSNGHCWWFGQWDLTYGDVYFNASGDPDVDPSCPAVCPEPGLKQSTINHVNPRDQACNPICSLAGTATLSGTTLTVSAVSGTLTNAIVGAGIQLGRSSGPFYTLVTCYNGYTGDYTGSCPSGTIRIDAAPTGFSNTFTLSNYVVYEPQLYVKAGQTIYFTANRRPPYHDGVAVRYNFSNQSLQELNAESPPYVSGGVTNSNPFANTFWNEFLTPDATGTHSIFMSDRATSAAANLGINPEYSDHYLCTGVNCSNIVRLTYFDDAGLDATLSPCGPNLGNGNCYPITAVRGAWSPSGTQYMTLVEYLVRATNYGGPPGAALYLYSLTYPNTEVSGHAILSGHVTVGR